MSSATEFPVKGKVVAVGGGYVVINPAATNYELQLEISGSPNGLAVGHKVQGVIRVTGRKLWTVPSGGNFIAPIFGPPRILQGRVRWLDEKTMVLHAGLPVIVELPDAGSGRDLTNGPLAVGTMANVTAFAGAKFEPMVEAM